LKKLGDDSRSATDDRFYLPLRLTTEVSADFQARHLREDWWAFVLIARRDTALVINLRGDAAERIGFLNPGRVVWLLEYRLAVKLSWETVRSRLSQYNVPMDVPQVGHIGGGIPDHQNSLPRLMHVTRDEKVIGPLNRQASVTDHSLAQHNGTAYSYNLSHRFLFWYSAP
jgi:hypothetical protein